MRALALAVAALPALLWTLGCESSSGCPLGVAICVVPLQLTVVNAVDGGAVSDVTVTGNVNTTQCCSFGLPADGGYTYTLQLQAPGYAPASFVGTLDSAVCCPHLSDVVPMQPL